MNKNLANFIRGKINVIDGNFIITRERSPNGNEYIRIISKEANGEKLLYDFWHNPRRKRELTEKPKHTGGKQPYIMLMINEIESLRKKGVKNIEELVGYVVILGRYIEWNTGKLIHKKTKEPLKYKDLLELYSCSRPKLNKMIALMKEHGLLYYTEEGYFISNKYIKKGKSQKNEQGRGQ